MVTTKLLPTLYSSTILPKPRLRRSITITFGSSYAHAYGYEKLSNEYESQSLVDSMKSCDSGSSSNVTLCDVAGPADDDSTAVDSVFSVLFSVGDQSMSSGAGECSYSYSLCSDTIIRWRPHRPSFKKRGEDCVTIDTSDYSNCTFDLRLMSRHAGLDYNGRTLPKVSTSPIIKSTIASRDDMPHGSLQSSHDADILEGARIVKEHLGVIACHQVLEETFDSDIDEDLSTSAQLLPGKVGSVSDERKQGYSVRKWFRRRNPVSSLRSSLTSPAA